MKLDKLTEATMLALMGKLDEDKGPSTESMSITKSQARDLYNWFLAGDKSVGVYKFNHKIYTYRNNSSTGTQELMYNGKAEYVIDIVDYMEEMTFYGIKNKREGIDIVYDYVNEEINLIETFTRYDNKKEETKSIKSKRSRRLENRGIEGNNSWFGVEGAKFISRGSWSDPEVSYKGYLYNYWDIADFVYNCMVEDYKEEGKELPAENTPEYENLFNEYMEKEVPNALIDLHPQELDPSVMQFIEYGHPINGIADLIKSADKIVKGYSLNAIEKRLETLKEITNIPDSLIDEAINLVKNTATGTDMEDSFDEDERTEEIIPMIKKILSNTDVFFENKQIKKENKKKTEVKNKKLENIQGNHQGICPKCGSMITNYGHISWDDEGIGQEFNCTNPKCKAHGTEYYNTTFDYIEVEENEKKTEVKKKTENKELTQNNAELMCGYIADLFTNESEDLYSNFESFIDWCEDGDVFRNADFPEEKCKELDKILKEVAPLVDDVSNTLYEYVTKD